MPDALDTTAPPPTLLEAWMGRPPDQRDPASGYHLWFLDHPVVCGAFGPSAHVTEAPAAFLIGDLMRAVERRYGAPAVIIHDWSRMQGYDQGARRDLTRFVRSRPRLLKHTFIIPPREHRISSMALQMVATMLRGFKIPFTVQPDLEQALREHAAPHAT